jgi:hypothetical protein
MAARHLPCALLYGPGFFHEGVLMISSAFFLERTVPVTAYPCCCCPFSGLLHQELAKNAYIYQNGQDMEGHEAIGACQQDRWTLSSNRHFLRAYLNY